MDPDANLSRQLLLARAIRDAYETKRDIEIEMALEESSQELAELVLSLDLWMAQGGKTPERWLFT